jgi:hypothetical protein
MSARRSVTITALTAPLLFVAGCSASAAPPPSAITATVSEFKVATTSPNAVTGPVTFTVTNGGAATHEFVIFKSDLAADKLPLDAEGRVDENATGVSHVDEVEDVTAGSSKTLTVSLDPGRYVLICNLPGHYVGGMHVALEVVKKG